MSHQPGNDSVPEPLREKGRPVILSLLVLFSMIYFALLAILFLLCLFYSGDILRVRALYNPGSGFAGSHLYIFFFMSSLLHLVAFAGATLVWKLRKTGYYLFTLSCLLLFTLHLFQPQVSPGSNLAYIILPVLIGLFFTRLH
ncbi:MAG: hypothetical protein WCO44_02440 [Bacteroidota bacterium]